MNPKLYDVNIGLLKSLPAKRVPSTIPVVRELREAVGGATRVLDVGCGSGAKTASLATWTSASILGIDVNEAAIADARARHAMERVRFLAADVTDPMALVERFDVINMSAILTCVIPRESRDRVLQSCSQLLTPDGLLVIADFLQSPHLPQYRERYEQGEAATGDPGSFRVADAESHASLYYAHHFSEEEIRESIRTAGLGLQTFRKTEFTSATGHRLNGFVLTAHSR